MGFSLARPATVGEAIAALAAAPGARAIAGGTDLLLDLEEGRLSSERLVSLTRLPWRTVRTEGERLVIGSTLPLRTLERREGLGRDLPGLMEAIRSVGSVALRHRATIGGNLARAAPASDLVPILIALEASVRLVGPAGSRTVAVDRFVRASRSVDLADGELIESVEVPVRARCAYAWQRVRPANDISQVGVAVARRPGASHWAIALGGVSPRAVRLPRAESALGADPTDPSALARAGSVAAEEAPFASDRRASDPYRRRLVEILVRRAIERANGGAA